MTSLARTAALVSLSALILSACEDGQGFNFGNTSPEEVDATEAETPQAPRTVLKDVERPDIFNVTELALWDGRPSLGGVWVAHPDISTPERVILTNTTNGKSIPGALFRRERDNPGPRIQVSSEAAGALGMLAGQPVELKVLVVRQEEVVIEPAPQPEAEETPVSTEELAAAGIVDDADTGEASPPVEAEAEEQPKRPNFFQRLFRKKPATEAAAIGAGVAAATVDDASAPDVETSTLDPVTTSAAAAITRAESSQAPKARPERASTPAPAAAPAPAPSNGLKNPYIQVGLFSVEANADAAASNLRQSGIIPTIVGTNSGSWRVVIGPVSTADDQAALLAQVKNLGYTDAFLAPE